MLKVLTTNNRLILLITSACLTCSGWECWPGQTPQSDDTADDGCPAYDIDCDGISNAVEQNPANAYLDLDYQLVDNNPTRALGTPENGTLQNGLNLPDNGTGYWHNVGTDPVDEDDWGVLHMMKMIEGAGRDWVASNMTPPRITVNDISLRDGGYWEDHSSHQNGLDVDMRYIRKDGTESPLDLGTETGRADYDSHATLLMLNALFKHSLYRITKIYISPNCLITFTGFEEGEVVLTATHNDHFHLRIQDPDGTSN